MMNVQTRKQRDPDNVLKHENSARNCEAGVNFHDHFLSSKFAFISLDKLLLADHNKATRLDAGGALSATIGKTISTGELPVSTGPDRLAEVILEATAISPPQPRRRAKPSRHPVDRTHKEENRELRIDLAY